jgi:hypothetical protein
MCADCYYITDTGLGSLARMSGLTQLEIVFCDHITDAGLAHLCSLDNLHTLSVEGCDEISVSRPALETWC